MSEEQEKKQRDPDEPFLGSAVKNKIIRFTSVTQIAMADYESEGCLRKWGFRYVFGKKLVKTSALVKGDYFAQKQEHYLKTGEDVLPPVLHPIKKFLPTPGKDLEVEEAFATGPRGLGKDIEKAITLREGLVKSSGRLSPSAVDSIRAEIKKFARLVIRDIPVDGAADFRHRRGVFVDEDGKLRGEVPGMIVVETGDLKTMSRIHPQKIMSGENAGTILPTYAKTSAQVCNDVQMVTYGVFGADKYPDSTHARLSHIIANKTKREAVKRTGLISVEQLRERFRRIEGIVDRMIDVACADKVEDIEPNISACDAYTHIDPTDPEKKRILPGCDYRYECPLSTAQVGFSLFGHNEEKVMGLSAFDQLDGTPAAPTASQAPAAPTPPLDAAAYAAAVEAEKQRLAAQAAAPPPTPSPGVPCLACGMALSTMNSSVLPDGKIKHIGCAAELVPQAPAPPIPAPPVLPVEGAIGVKPPDAPVHDWIDQARPMPDEEIAQVADPELRAKLELHAKLWNEREAAKLAAQPQLPAAEEPWCQPKNPKVVITAEIFAAKKFVCHCGKAYSTTTLKPLKEGDQFYSVIPKHKPLNKKTEALAAPAAAPPPPQLSAGQPSSAPGYNPPPVAPQPPQLAAPSSPIVVPPPPPAATNGHLNGEMTTMIDKMFGAENVKQDAVAQLFVDPAAEIARAIIAALEPIAKRGVVK